MGAVLTPEQKARVRRQTTAKLARHFTDYAHVIDISTHQGGPINWQAVKDFGNLAGVYTKATQGERIKDARFKANWGGAKSVGLPRGAYLFYEPEQDPVRQCDLFSAVVDVEPGDLIPCVDLERASPELPAVLDEMRLQRVCDILEIRYGKPPIIYTSKRYLDSEGILHLPPGCPLWIVDYVSQDEPKMPKGADDWALWQYGFAPGLAGIGGDVDRNFLRWSIEALRL